VSVRDAASLLTGSPQYGVKNTSYATATGRTIIRSTWQGSTRLEHALFAYDRLGHRTGMTRYQDAANGASPVTSSWRFDSLGQMLELDEPDSAPQLRAYSYWGELTSSTRTIPGSSTSLSVRSRYDAYGRLIHQEQRRDTLVDADTVMDYQYDVAVNLAPQVTPTNVLGRMTQASSPTGLVSFSYDAFGRIDARVFTDTQGGLYVEKHATHADGSPASLDLFLPDTAYADEHVDYTHDSAGRGRSVKYTSGADTADLFEASTIDSLGRVRQAQYGQTTYSATYADVGRQLLNQATVSSPLGSRAISFPSYDSVGRERSRNEVKNGFGSAVTTASTYDALGQLSHAVQTVGTTTLFDQHFTYDPLGNILSISDAPSGSAATNTTLSYLSTDRDRICHLAYDSDGNTACNVAYDEVGNIISQKTATGVRQYSYYIDGSVRTITDDKGSEAHFRYDAFGEVQELELTSPTSLDSRHDRSYGGLIAWRDVMTGMSPTSVLTRKIPGPDGFVASRRGAGGPWVFEFGEARGTRFFTDQNGAFVQDVEYQPFGAPKSTGAQPGSLLYSNEQWNFGDALAAFGISKLGARLYDPAIGRFLSRDPLLIPRTSATTNAYAFAMNDPMNGSDPSGLDEEITVARPPTRNEDRGAGGESPLPATFDLPTGGGDPFTALNHLNGNHGRGSSSGSSPVSTPLNPAASQALGILGLSLVPVATNGVASSGIAASSGSGLAGIGTALGGFIEVGLIAAPVIAIGVSLKIANDHPDACFATEDPTICLELQLEWEAAGKAEKARAGSATQSRADVRSAANKTNAGFTTFYHGTTVAGANSIMADRLLPVSVYTNPYLSGSLFTFEASQPNAYIAASMWPVVSGKGSSADARVIQMRVPNDVLLEHRSG
jgi:RHS repeat-associated protein